MSGAVPAMPEGTAPAQPGRDERLRRWRLVLGGEEDGTGVGLRGDDVGIDGVLAALYEGAPGGRCERAAPRWPRPQLAAGRPVAGRHPPLLPEHGGAGHAARRHRAARPHPAPARTGDAVGAGARHPPGRRAADPAGLPARRGAGHGAAHRGHRRRRDRGQAGSATAPGGERRAARATCGRAGRGRATSTGTGRSRPTCATGCRSGAPSCRSTSSASVAWRRPSSASS